MSATNNSSPICIDTNLVLRLLLGGPNRQEVRDQWDRWIEKGVTLIAPPLFAFEVTSVLRYHVYRKLITAERGWHAFQSIFNQGIRLEYPPNLHKRAWQIAQRFNLPAAYDAHYGALADHFACEFWTLDHKLYKSIQSDLPWVHTIPEQK